MLPFVPFRFALCDMGWVGPNISVLDIAVVLCVNMQPYKAAKLVQWISANKVRVAG